MAQILPLLLNYMFTVLHRPIFPSGLQYYLQNFLTAQVLFLFFLASHIGMYSPNRPKENEHRIPEKDLKGSKNDCPSQNPKTKLDNK